MKKIMFSEEYGLEQAVLKNLEPNAHTWEMKNMTRRAITIPEKWHGIEVYGFCHVKGQASLELTDGDDFCIEDPKTGQCAQILPTYKVGEEVAIAQRYKDITLNPNFGIKERVEDILRNSKGWTNKMFVCAGCMPHRIRITNVKVERLQDISEEDCLREGIVKTVIPADQVGDDLPFGKVRYYYTYKGVKVYFDTAREAFATMINGMSRKKVWEENPLVWVYKFVVI